MKHFLVWTFIVNIRFQASREEVMMEPPDSEYKVLEGRPMTITCETREGISASAFHWFLQNQKYTEMIANSFNPYHISTATFSKLDFRPARHYHSWDIYCAAKTKYGTFYSNKSKINVYDPLAKPAFKSGSTFLRENVYKVINGGSVFIECITDSNPLASIRWETKTRPTDNRYLTIRNIRQENAGRYVCVATYQTTLTDRYTFTDQSNNSLHIDVLFSPIAPSLLHQGTEIPDGPLKVVNGSELVLECRSFGNPPPSYMWELGSRRHASSQITIKGDTSKFGTYTCIADNIMIPTFGPTETGQANRTLHVDILYPPSAPILMYRDQIKVQTMSVVRNTALDLSCHSFGNPMPFFRWKHGSSVYNQSRITLRGYTFESGTYSCVASNLMIPTFGYDTFGQSVSSLEIDVLYPPTEPMIIVNGTNISTDSLKIINGTAILLECQSSGNQKLSYRWKHGSMQFRGSRLELHGDITKNGTYTCVAENFMRPTIGLDQTMKAEKSLYVDVLYPLSVPKISYNGTELNVDLQIMNGTMLLLDCHSSGHPMPTYRWVHGSRMFNQSSIQLNVDTSDNGTYTCVAENMISPTVGPNLTGHTKKSLAVNVLYPPSDPKILMNGTDVNNSVLTVIERTRLSLKCVSDANPSPTIQWKTNGTKHAGDMLFLYDIQPSDARKYECVAKNEMIPTFGSSQKNKSRNTLELHVLYPPSKPQFFINGAELHTDMYTVTHGSDVLIECHSQGKPTPSIRLGYDFALQTSGERLSVKNIQEGDTGNYTCVAENVMTPTFAPNTIGRMQSSVRIILKDTHHLMSEPPSHTGLLFPLIAGGASLFLLAIAAVIVWRCRLRVSGAQDNIVENPMYISADGIESDGIAIQHEETGSFSTDERCVQSVFVEESCSLGNHHIPDEYIYCYAEVQDVCKETEQ
ncbi:hemicentin-1-like isoform X2 [Dreissena polymorpha]|uniref:hemicentin-1-like isoform X2 n=1 Tax=Dreissena polymorpha TaxID=45954 RepID=UPI002264F33E|nr:hemicentin-1-like isoform X2 [Dreissena polymorpha]